jgi:hypothetical protein
MYRCTVRLCSMVGLVAMAGLISTTYGDSARTVQPRSTSQPASAPAVEVPDPLERFLFKLTPKTQPPLAPATQPSVSAEQLAASLKLTFSPKGHCDPAAPRGALIPTTWDAKGIPIPTTWNARCIRVHSTAPARQMHICIERK